jgi:hypothetical protein
MRRPRKSEPETLNSLDVIERVKRWGPAVLLTGGDVVFQPRKVERSGLYDAVDGRALIYVHKERELADVEARYPAAHYVIIDDKFRILAAIKKVWGLRVTTIFVRQGHYARDAKMLASRPVADVTCAPMQNARCLPTPRCKSQGLYLP